MASNGQRLEGFSRACEEPEAPSGSLFGCEWRKSEAARRWHLANQGRQEA
jgi:hypothetical protein